MKILSQNISAEITEINNLPSTIRSLHAPLIVTGEKKGNVLSPSVTHYFAKAPLMKSERRTIFSVSWLLKKPFKNLLYICSDSPFVWRLCQENFAA